MQRSCGACDEWGTNGVRGEAAALHLRVVPPFQCILPCLECGQNPWLCSSCWATTSWKNIGKGVGGGNPGEPGALPALRSPFSGHSLKGGKQAPLCSKPRLSQAQPSATPGWCRALLKRHSLREGLRSREGGGKKPHGAGIGQASEGDCGHSEHPEDPISGQLAPGLNISTGRTRGAHAGGRERTVEDMVGSVYQLPRGGYPFSPSLPLPDMDLVIGPCPWMVYPPVIPSAPSPATSLPPAKHPCWS